MHESLKGSKSYTLRSRNDMTKVLCSSFYMEEGRILACDEYSVSVRVRYLYGNIEVKYFA